MSEKLFRLKAPLISNGLISALRNQDIVSIEEVKCKVDLTNLSALIDQLILEKVTGASLDARLVECVHTTFKSLPSHILTDMRMWHWLCVMRYPNIPWLRWRGNIPIDPEDGFTVGTGKKHVPSLRFLGTSSINGHGRNTFSRLFFAADRMMENDHSDYSLVKKLFTSQEVHQNCMNLYVPQVLMKALLLDLIYVDHFSLLHFYESCDLFTLSIN